MTWSWMHTVLSFCLLCFVAMGFGAGRTIFQKGVAVKYPAHGPGHLWLGIKELENGVFCPFLLHHNTILTIWVASKKRLELFG
jgi:hypothetical protein